MRSFGMKKVGPVRGDGPGPFERSSQDALDNGSDVARVDTPRKPRTGRSVTPGRRLPSRKAVHFYRANFALGHTRDFRAPDWPCGLRDNAPIHPLLLAGMAGERLASDIGQVRYTVDERQAPIRVLPKGRGDRGKRSMAR